MDEFWIGDLITFEGRTFTVCGLDPMGIPQQTVELEDTQTKVRLRLPIVQLRASARPAARTPAAPRPDTVPEQHRETADAPRRRWRRTR